MTTFLTIAVAVEAVAIVMLWLAVCKLGHAVTQLSDLAGKTLAVTDALGGVSQSIISAIYPVKGSAELKTMN